MTQIILIPGRIEELGETRGVSGPQQGKGVQAGGAGEGEVGGGWLWPWTFTVGAVFHLAGKEGGEAGAKLGWALNAGWSATR